MSTQPAAAKKVDGVQKVAAFLLSLDKEISAKVMRSLDPKVVSRVAEAMTDLDGGLCTPEAVDGLYVDIANTVNKRTGVRSQDDFELHEILAGTYGDEEAARVVGEIHERRRREQPFGFLDGCSTDLVTRLLADEPVSVVALILSHVSPNVSAAVLGTFDEERALATVKRMTQVSPPNVDCLLSMADDLRDRVRTLAAMPAPPDPGESLRTIADLLNHSVGDLEKSVMGCLGELDDELVDQVRGFMFTWDDLATIDRRAMQKILASVETQTLSLALKGSSKEVEANIMENLSSRVREMVADERELAGAVPLADVQAARSEVMTTVRALMDAGDFTPARAGQEMVS
ncbi:MAG: hypothetical protein ISQ08_11100 [Planctomycetes bacterium]|nr:hypothetical protein [Planctomycetota bacterium]